MRRTLGTTLLALILPLVLLAGCGDDDAGSAPDPAAGAPVLVSGTAGGGDVSTRATELADAGAVTAYVKQFSGSFATKVEQAADEVGVSDGNLLVAAVVSIGCDVPPGAVVKRSDGIVVITPRPVATPLEECLAPVTTVALAAVPG